MALFEIKLGDKVIGFSEFERGDADMGVAFGRLMPIPVYASIQPYCIEHRDHWINISGLAVQTLGGVPIECSGGIQIIDLSSNLAEQESKCMSTVSPTLPTMSCFRTM